MFSGLFSRRLLRGGVHRIPFSFSSSSALSSRGRVLLGASAGACSLWALSSLALADVPSESSSASSQESFSIESVKKFFSFEWLTGGLREPALQSFLPDPTPDSFGREPRTIVLAFEGTLVNTDWNRETGWVITKRPGVDKFLSRLFQLGYEIVIFSSNYEGITTPVINNFDKHQICSYRIFRECLLFEDGKYVKDLSRMNRDLSRVLVIDHNADAFSKHPDNGIIVPPYTGQKEDRELMKLLPFLESLVKEDVRDVRELIRGYGNENIADKYRAHMEAVQKMIMEEQSQMKKAGGWFGSALSGKKTSRHLNRQ